ncbi:MAG: redoxin [Desulfobulbus propionicus]|nr:MAG: redoxin [Desulfobulbus propionicus]
MNLFRNLAILTLFICLVPMTSFAVQPGDQLPYFSAENMEGNTYDLSRYIGKKPIMLVFWASWCPNCITEVPKVNKLVAQFQKKGMEFIAINIGVNDSKKRAASFIKKNKINYPVIFDTKQAITNKYKVIGVPTIIVADSKGVVQFAGHGTPEITDSDFKKLRSR